MSATGPDVANTEFFKGWRFWHFLIHCVGLSALIEDEVRTFRGQSLFQIYTWKFYVPLLGVEGMEGVMALSVRGELYEW